MSNLTIFDAEDSFNEGSLRFEEWLEESEARWYRPLGKTMMAVWLQSLPQEVSEALRQRNPEAFEAVVGMISKRGGNYGS